MDFKGDRTVIIPTPGGKPSGADIAPASDVKEPSNWGALFDDADKFISSGFNRLENAAFKLLSLIPTIKKSHSNPSAGLLRQQIVEEIETYETTARSSGIDSRTVMIGRYILCTVLDEVVLNTPWGGQSDWRTRSLLSHFHKETWGGENFFVMLENLEKDPSANIDLLELMYVCLTLGFEGRYAVEPDRIGKLTEIRSRLYRLIRSQRGESARQLSPHWHGVTVANRKLRRFMPLWVFASVLAGLMALLFFGLMYSLNQASNPPYQALAVLGQDATTTFDRPKVVDLSALEKLKTFLKPEIDENLLAVDERNGHVRIIIQGDRLFDSGQARINTRYDSLLKRVALALFEVDGKVLVEGHSDSQPINTLKFPSNWHLSVARADQVKAMLEQHTQEFGRFSSEGKADTQPVADNATAQGRSKNRRVEIVLLSNVVWRTNGGSN
jgi:type VI secretion system protein ImpK